MSRSLPRTPTPGASPLPIGGRPFDGRYNGAGFSSIHGMPSNSAASPPQAVITSDTTRSGSRSRSTGTFSTAIRAARWWIFAPASVSSSSSVGSSPMSSTASTPADRAVSSHSVPVSSVGASPAARNRRHSASAGKACPGSGPATTATRMRLHCHRRRGIRLASMTETTSAVDTDGQRADGGDVPLRAAGPGLRRGGGRDGRQHPLAERRVSHASVAGNGS